MTTTIHKSLIINNYCRILQNALLKDVFEIGLASNVQLFNKDTNEDENEKQGKSKAELDQEQQKLSDFITQNYPVKEKIILL